jgi:hypothetical protein
MGVANINLRDGTAASLLHHQVALLWIKINSDFFNMLNAF